MKSCLAGLVSAILLLLATASPLTAREEILLFESSIEVEPDGSLLVEELIRVRAEGRQIRRGIYRDLPIRYREGAGLYRQVGFTLLEVRRDGRPEPHRIERLGDFIRIYAGEESVVLRTGEYTYLLRYRTTRQIRHFETYDELYWNVTGNFWSFPIRRAVGKVMLPEGARILQEACYTGRFGQAQSACRVALKTDRAITFESTGTLAAAEGLTAAVAFPKGIVPEASSLQRLAWAVTDNLGLVLLLVSVAGTGLYFLRTWRQVGQDPDRGVVVPLFTPPKGLSPAAVSYVQYQGFDDVGGGIPRAFIAAIVSLAVKRLIRIDEVGESVAIESTGATTKALPRGEAAIVSILLGGRKRFEFSKENGTTLADAQSRFRSAMLKEHGGVFFKNNYHYFAIGAAISVVGLAAYLILARPSEEQIMVLAMIFAAAMGGSLLIAMGARRVLGWMPGGGSLLTGVPLTILGLIVAVLVAAVLVVFHAGLPLIPAAALIAVAVMNVVFFHLLRAPTAFGRKVMDEIEGFRLYLSVAEAEWMNMPKAPAMAEQLFEHYLPYAVALGVEKPWSDAFEGYLKRTMPDSDRNSLYRSDWYSGRNWPGRTLGRATSGMVSSLSSSMAAAMPSQSSSGSGGGGSSGGGGGGGGGGGW